MQKQNVCNSYGLFTIAFAADIPRGNSSGNSKLDLTQMPSHLLCLKMETSRSFHITQNNNIRWLNAKNIKLYWFKKQFHNIFLLHFLYFTKPSLKMADEMFSQNVCFY